MKIIKVVFCCGKYFLLKSQFALLDSFILTGFFFNISTCFLFPLQPAPMVTKARPMLPLAFLILTNLNLVANLQTAIGTTVTKTHLRRPQILRIILNKNRSSSIKKPTQTAKNQSHLKKFVKTPLLLMEVPPEASLTKPIPFPVLLLLPLPAPPPRL